MSGGSLDYFYCQLQEHVGDFKDKELDDLVNDLAALFHDREWYLSGDIGPGGWNEARDNFKKKWFSESAREERIEKYLDEVKAELLRSFGVQHNYCKDCRHWTQQTENYGKCEFAVGYLNHAYDACDRDKWENKG